MNWLDFLTRVKHSNDTFNIGKRVCVIGVGNTACDVARVAIRLGAETVAMKGIEELAFKWEIEEAIKEGIEVQTSVAPKRIIRDGNGFQINFIRIKMDGSDSTGKSMPEEISGSEFQSHFDSVIVAIGQTPDIPQAFVVRLGRRGVIDIDGETMETSIAGVFAGGDIATGEGSIIQAVAAGKQAAISIDKYLRKNGEVEQPEGVKLRFRGKSEDEIGESLLRNIAFEIPSLAPEKRVRSFVETELGLTEEAAVEQARRCWRCDRYHLAEK